MLPKVSAALSKFVTPIQTTSGGSSAHEKEFVRTQPGRKAKVLPFKGSHSRDQASDHPPKDQNPEKQPGATQDPTPESDTRRPLTESFLSLVDSLRQNGGSIFKWIGINGYRLGIKATRRGGKLRKGAMLDTRVD